MSSSINQW